ncbi:MAG TPA: hypothetical protein EYP85_09860 [Armatimonadetes bacterium]|nr:hypothetical protein [Armatimonadota bacterium]
MFDTFRNRYLLCGRLEARTALHVGSASALGELETESPVIKTVLGEPFIPGSSFKGVLRSLLETLLHPLSELWRLSRPVSHSCRLTQRFPAFATLYPQPCLITTDNSTGCLSVNKTLRNAFNEWRRTDPDDHAILDEVRAHSCPLCLLLGSPYLQSRVLVADLPVVAETWAQETQVRDGVAINRDSRTAEGGRLYDFEVVPPGTQFRWKILVENVKEWELGMLFVGLMQFTRDGLVSLGGRTSRGLGRVLLHWDSVEAVEAASLIEWLTTRQGKVYGLTPAAALLPVEETASPPSEEPTLREQFVQKVLDILQKADSLPVPRKWLQQKCKGQGVTATAIFQADILLTPVEQPQALTAFLDELIREGLLFQDDQGQISPGSGYPAKAEEAEAPSSEPEQGEKEGEMPDEVRNFVEEKIRVFLTRLEQLSEKKEVRESVQTEP